MGTWGVGIRQDDFVRDVENAFKDLLKDGKTPADATRAGNRSQVGVVIYGLVAEGN